MTTSIQDRVSPSVQRRRARWPLTPAQRKVVLTLHVLSASVWIGIDVLTAVLVGTGLVNAGSGVYEALGRYVLVPTLVAAIVASLACLVTGVLLGLGTKWGLLRYWWVAVKFGLNIVLSVAVVVILIPVNQIATGQRTSGDVSFLFTIALIALALLVFAEVLSVFKPWGRVRR